MRRLFSVGLILLLGFLLSACGDKTVKGNGRVTTQNRPVSQFDRIKAVGGLNLLVDVNQSERVSVTTDDNLQPYILTEIRDKTLEISTKKGYLLASAKPIRIQVNAPKLLSLASTGSAQVNVTDIEGHRFDVHSTGTSQLVLAGKVSKVSIGVTGASQVDARNLITDETSLDVSGTAKASIHAKTKLNVKISGDGIVVYYGKPTFVNQAVFGNGKIRPAAEQ